MSTHPLLQNRSVAAICPRCGQSALRRQHRTSSFDELRKRFSLRRPFICTRCGWSGWIDEAFLRYAPHSPQASPLAENRESDHVPELDLDAPVAKSPATSGAWKTSGEGLRAIVRGNEDTRAAIDDVPDLSLDDDAPVPPPRTPSQGTPVQSTPSLLSADDSIHEGGLEENSPYSEKVGEAFHHQARHTGKSCPACHAWTLYRSRTRSAGEALRKTFTTALLYRCHACGWRGWMRNGWS